MQSISSFPPLPIIRSATAKRVAGKARRKRACGLYTSVHEDRRRSSNAGCGPLSRSDRLEHAGGTHAGAYAHRHDAVFLSAALQSVRDRRRANRARRAERMAERDRAAERIDLRGVEVELAHDGERLRGERLVELDPVDVLLPDAGQPQQLGYRSGG